MIITTLSEKLSIGLKDADEVWIATAMISDKGLEFLNAAISPETKRTYMIGIDLPTSVSVLKKILSNLSSGKSAAKIGKPEHGIFHPKLYLIGKDQLLTAYLGSANLTEGGLSNNTELSIEITDQIQCNAILLWFKELYEQGYPLNAENIAIYEDYILAHPPVLGSRGAIKLKRTNPSKDVLNDINFSDRFFRKEDHLAFRPSNWKNKGHMANRERHDASIRFMELHDILYPQFKAHGLTGLYPNQKPHITSMTYHHDNSQKNIDAMWLSYGKSPQEIKEYHALFPKTQRKNEENDLQSFINHARLQIRIELREIGIWILFGKNNKGSMFDRGYFLDSMKKEKYRSDFYILLKMLPSEYWIRVNGLSRDVSAFSNPDNLYQFCNADDPENYFIIGRDYMISDDEMSATHLAVTTLKEFKRLFPIYQMMRHRI